MATFLTKVWLNNNIFTSLNISSLTLKLIVETLFLYKKMLMAEHIFKKFQPYMMILKGFHIINVLSFYLVNINVLDNKVEISFYIRFSSEH